MTRAWLLVPLVASAIVATPAAGRTQTDQTFRTTADVVMIDVTVRANGTPVAGLTAADFVLVDNGVQQEIEAVELEAVPIDVTIVVDTGADMSDDIGGLAGQVRRIAALARPTDRVRLMSAGTYVTDLVPATAVADVSAWPDLSTSGTMAAYDALAAALLRPVPSDRRHLVIAIMNGIDAISAIDATAVRAIARVSGATLNIAQVDMTIEARPPNPPLIQSGRERLDAHRCMASRLCQPTRQFWVPYDERRFETLDEAARSTGGEVYFPSLFTTASASAIFERAFADYRRSYLLRYTPRGIDREGWHEVEVTLPGHPSYSVRARRGYSVEPAVRPRPAGAPPSPSPSPSPSPFDALVTAYDAGNYGLAFGLMRRNPAGLIRELSERGNPWPANPRREAALVIELGQAALAVGGRAHLEARQLLSLHAELIRHPVEPDAFERDWHWARLAMALNTGNTAISAEFIDAALARFPDEPRFVLARAVVLDQRRPLDITATSAGEPLSAHTSEYVREVLARYEDAMRFEGTAAEAGVRAAWLLHRVGRYDEALARLHESERAPAGPGLSYLRHLIRGRTLDALGRLDEAVSAFRAARERAPAAQSAQVGLMTTLLRLGDRAEAERLAELLLTLPGDAIDPWWAYWSGDYRFFGEIVDRLRELSR